MKRKNHAVRCYTVKQEGVIQFLLIHQTLGHWTFPKGHVEDGETEQQTAYREILEETGIEVSFEDGFRVINTYSPKRGYSERCYFLF